MKNFYIPFKIRKVSCLLIILISLSNVVFSKTNNIDYNSSPNVYIDQNLAHDFAGLNVHAQREDVLHFFSHGKPGALFLNGKWRNAIEIVDYIKAMQLLSNKITAINIYGCAFAKGAKGKAAVAFLAKTLHVVVAASTNITGIDGDWALEVGTNYDNIGGIQYNGNLQCPNFGTAPNQDFDCDDVINANDLDDDNDGILDAVEAPNCYFTAAEANVISNVSTALTIATGTTPLLHNGVIVSATPNFSFTANQAIANATIFNISYPTPVKLSSVTIVNNTSLATLLGSAILQGSVDGVNWVNLSAVPVSIATNTNKVFTVDQNTNDYSIYRILGVTSLSVTTTNPVFEIISVVNNDYIPSAHPKPNCGADLDADGLTNNFDVDADGDGCFDAIEGGALLNSTNINATGMLNGGVSTAITTNGVPTVAGAGQTINYSQSKFVNDCADTDSDGVLDIADLDDDNDGILDAIEAPSCFYTSAEANGIVDANTGLAIATGSLPLLYNGVTVSANPNFSFTANQPLANANIFTITYPTPLQLTSVTIVNAASLGTNATAHLQGSVDGVTWVNLTATPVAISTASNKVFTVTQNASEYTFYRILGVATANSLANPIFEITSVINTNYIQSAHPKLSCAADLDLDGIPNNIDFDSDGDGCFDAIESGAMFTTANINTQGALIGGVSTIPATNGVPLIAGVGQSINFSQNNALNECIDSDSDGVNDLADLDDDNDGIPDSIENSWCEPTTATTVLPTGTFTTVPSTNFSSSTPPVTSGIDGSICLATFGATATRTYNFNTTLINPIINFYGIDYAKQEWFDQNDEPVVFRILAVSPPTLIDGNIITITNDPNTVTANSPVNSAYGNVQIMGNVTSLKVKYTWLLNTNNCDGHGFSFMQPTNCPLNFDIDNDGILNSLDLDADGDGCADVFEGTGTFNINDVTTSAMPGGNNGAGYNGTTTLPVNQNLGIVVGITATTLGIPTIAGVGQGLGYSQNITVNTCVDTDNDGISNVEDLDDENDGILDAVESSACYFSVAEANDKSEITTDLTINTGSRGLLYDGVIINANPNFSFATGQQLANATLFRISYPTPVNLTSVTIVNNATLGAGATAKLQGSIDGITWLDLTAAPVALSTAANKVFTVAQNAADYSFYRILGVATATSTINPIFEITSVVNGNYVPSAHPKPTCVDDIDNDGLTNNIDVDADGDGCFDAIEGGAMFTTNNLNANGTLVGVVSTATATNGVPTIAGNGQTANFSQSAAFNKCIDTDGDGVNDLADLDDDNDGILDVAEGYTQCLITPTSATVNTTFSTQTVIGNTINSTGFSGTNLSAIVNSPGVLADNWLSLEPASTAIIEYTMPANTTLSGIALWAPDLLNYGGGDGPVKEFTATLTYGNGLTYTSPVFNTLKPTGNGSLSEAQVFTFNQIFNNVTKIRLNVTAGWFDVNNDNVNYVATNSGVAVLSNYNMSLAEFRALCPPNGIDTDNDGIQDHLDLDSDGDGCADAIEGGANFTAADLVASNIPGGNSGAGFNGTSASPVTQNLGNTVGSTPTTIGVPTIAATGQTVNYSTSKFVNECTDTDGDGVSDVTDLDDDNDGILDAVEAPNCYFTNNEANDIIAVNSGLTVITGATPLLYDGVTTNANPNFAFNVGQPLANANIFTITYPTPVNLTSITIVNTASLGTGATATLQGSVDGITWLDLTATPVAIGTATNKVFAVTQNAGEYTFYRVLGVATATTLANPIFEITSVINTNYIPSAHPKLACALDTDGDGITNNLDLDSDGDGCADAVEGGANFTVANLVTSTIPGGNSGTGFNGTSATPVTQNLGNIVGSTPTTLGVPTIAGNGQTINFSQEPLVNECIDTDGDGILDFADLDDDNDGILDEVENACTSPNPSRAWATWSNASGGTITGTIATASNGNVGVTVSGPGIYSTNLFNPTTVTTFDATIPTGVVPANQQAGNISVLFSTIVTDPLIFFTSLGQPTVPVRMTTSVPHTVLQQNGTALVSNDMFTVTGREANFVLQLHGTFKSFTINYDIAETFSNFSFGLKNICPQDLDNDGIINSLDLDSDGDGCADAIEGGANFTVANLVNSTIPGGNSGTTFNGTTTNPVTQNLGNMVSSTLLTLGVPTIAGTGQSVFYSQNKFINECTDTDGDGINDFVDLDDDNDGILDAVEAPACYFTATEANVITGITTELGISTGTTALLSDGVTTTATPNFSFVNAQALAGRNLFTITYPTAVNLTSISIVNTTSLGTNATAKLQGSVDGVLWVDLTSTPVSISTTVNKVFTINQNAGGYRFYRIQGVATATIINNPIFEITSVVSGSYVPSANPKETCTVDTDGDGISNNLDADSDGDGCLDAIEGGGNFNYNSLNGTQISGPVGATGIPLAAGSGQTIGTSQNAAMKDAACTFPSVDPDFGVGFIGAAITGNLATNNNNFPTGTVYSNTPTVPVGVTNPSASIPTINADGTYTFTTNVPGVYVFNVQVCEPAPSTYCVINVLTITVNNPNATNNPPIANPDLATTLVGVPVVLNTLSNDAPGINSAALNKSSVAIVPGSGPSNGTVSVDPITGNITYTPNPGFTGIDRYSYTVCDNAIPPKCVTSYQEIRIVPMGNNITSASDDFVTTPVNTTVTGNALTNDFDAEGNTLNISNPGTYSAAGGTLVLNANGTYSFTPTPGFAGPVRFPYTVCDNGTPQACDNATIHLLVSQQMVLPVNFVSVNAKAQANCKVKVTWNTGTELNINRFVLEQSNNGIDFKVVNTTAPKGSGSSYTALVDGINGVHFYRIRSIDIDNSFQLSSTIKVENGCEGAIKIFPNPATDKVTIANVGGNEKVQVALYNATGMLVFSNAYTSNNVIEINIKTLPTGVYTIKIISEFNTKVEKLIKL